MKVNNKMFIGTEYHWSNTEIFYIVNSGLIVVNTETGKSSYHSYSDQSSLKEFLINFINSGADRHICDSSIEKVLDSIMGYYRTAHVSREFETTAMYSVEVIQDALNTAINDKDFSDFHELLEAKECQERNRKALEKTKLFRH